MKEIIYNYENLKEEEIDEVVVRTKALIINDKEEIILGYSAKTYQFPGGHLEEGETLEEPVSDEAPVDYALEYSTLKEQYDALMSEVEELRSYKANIESEKRKAEEESVFSKFDCKIGHIEDYTNLKSNCSEYSISELEEKCYAIVGRYGISMISDNQTEEESSTRFSLNTEEKVDLPYGNVFK